MLNFTMVLFQISLSEVPHSTPIQVLHISKWFMKMSYTRTTPQSPSTTFNLYRNLLFFPGFFSQSIFILLRDYVLEFLWRPPLVSMGKKKKKKLLLWSRFWTQRQSQSSCHRSSYCVFRFLQAEWPWRKQVSRNYFSWKKGCTGVTLRRTQ